MVLDCIEECIPSDAVSDLDIGLTVAYCPYLCKIRCILEFLDGGEIYYILRCGNLGEFIDDI